MRMKKFFKSKALPQTLLLTASGNLGFSPEQVMYVEGSYQFAFHNYFQTHHSWLVECFKDSSAGLDFVYIPVIQNDILDSSDEISLLAAYFLPYTTPRFASRPAAIDTRESTAMYSQKIFSSLQYHKEIQAGFLRLMEGPDSAGNHVFTYSTLDASKDIEAQITAYISHIDFTRKKPISSFKAPAQAQRNKMARRNIAFDALFDNIDTWDDVITHSQKAQEVPKAQEVQEIQEIQEVPPKQDICDNLEAKSRFEFCQPIEIHPFVSPEKQEFVTLFQKEYCTLEKIKKHIEELKSLGYYEVLIRDTLIKLMDDDALQSEDLKLSRLYMDSEFKIYLPDYRNVEIKMTTLPKALFILFLRHPKGIALKQLSDYEPELMKIYQLISSRENLVDMGESIKRICSPWDQSVNEKLSRIREAFVCHISDYYAQHYYITGERSKQKGIQIDRSLVSLPKALQF